MHKEARIRKRVARCNAFEDFYFFLLPKFMIISRYIRPLTSKNKLSMDMTGPVRARNRLVEEKIPYFKNNLIDYPVGCVYKFVANSETILS